MPATIDRPGRDARADLAGVLLALLPVVAVVLFGAVEEEHAFPIETLALLFGAVAVVRRARAGDGPLPYVRVTLPLLLLALLPALQLISLPGGLVTRVSPGLGAVHVSGARALSAYRFATSLALLRWLAYAAYLIGALEVLRRPGAARSALTVIAALGIAEAIYGIGNLLLGNHYILWVPRAAYLDDATGTLVNHNHYATLMALSTLALLARRWLAHHARHAREERGITIVYLAGATVTGLAVVMSHSRGGIVSLGAGLAVLAMLVGHDRAARRGRWAVAAVIALVIGYGAYAGLGQVSERFARAPAAAESRTAVWRDTIAVIRDFPLVGAGAGTFEMVFPAYRHYARGQEAYAHAHQDYLELMAEGGIVALALAAAAAVGFGASLRAGLARARGRRRLVLAALGGALVAVLTHAALDFPLHIPGLVFLLLLLAAITLGVADAPDRP